MPNSAADDPQDPRQADDVIKLANSLREAKTQKKANEILERANDDDVVGWSRYYFMEDGKFGKQWQLIVINRWLERDKFNRNILPAWLGVALSVFSLVVSILALIVAFKPPELDPVMLRSPAAATAPHPGPDSQTGGEAEGRDRGQDGAGR
jgi:hypothetical protein